MNETDIRSALVDILGRIAPEARGTAVPDDDDLRETLGLDSMDFLHFVVGLHERLHVDVPERDYPQVTTLRSAVAYVAAHQQNPAAP